MKQKFENNNGMKVRFNSLLKHKKDIFIQDQNKSFVHFNPRKKNKEKINKKALQPMKAFQRVRHLTTFNSAELIVPAEYLMT